MANWNDAKMLEALKFFQNDLSDKIGENGADNFNDIMWAVSGNVNERRRKLLTSRNVHILSLCRAIFVINLNVTQQFTSFLWRHKLNLLSITNIQKQKKWLQNESSENKNWKLSFLIRAVARRHQVNKFRLLLLSNRIDLVWVWCSYHSLSLTHAVSCIHDLFCVVRCTHSVIGDQSPNLTLSADFSLLLLCQYDKCIQTIQTFTWLSFHSHLATHRML